MHRRLDRPPHHQIIRLPEVMARTAMSRSWIYQEAAAGRFPRPVKIGRASGWDASAVDVWIADRLSTSVQPENASGVA